MELADGAPLVAALALAWGLIDTAIVLWWISGRRGLNIQAGVRDGR